jgi:MFS family permease
LSAIVPAVETPPRAVLTRGQLALAMVLLVSINAFGFIDRVIIALVAEKIKAEFFLSDLQIGLLGGTAFAVVNAFASVPIARLAERFSRASVTAGFLLLASLFTALAGVTTSFLQLLACRVGMAAGNAVPGWCHRRVLWMAEHVRVLWRARNGHCPGCPAVAQGSGSAR